MRPIRFLVAASTFASTCDARRFRSPENLALLSIPVWNYALVSLIEVLLMGGELWDFHHRFDTVRRFPVFGRARILA